MWKNRLLVLLALIASAVLIGFRGGAFSYLLFYSALSIPVFSLIYLFYVFVRFRIYQYIDHKTLVKEDTTPYQFILSNEDILTYSYVDVTFLSDTAAIGEVSMGSERSLLPGESRSWDTTLTCHYRGIYHAGIDRVEIRDYFQLFRLVYPIPTHITVTVLPRVLHLPDFLPLQKEDQLQRMRPNPTLRPEMLDTDVRSYLAGDSMRQIHWKATAAQGKPFSRSYVEEPKAGLYLITDLTRQKGTELECLIAEDKLIETALAAADYLLREHITANFLLDEGGLQSIPLRDQNDFDYFYQYCASTQFQSALSAHELVETALRQAISDGVNQVHLLIVTQSITHELCSTCFQALTGGHRIGIICIGGGERASYTQELDERIEFFLIHPDQKLEDVLCKGN